MISGSPFNDEAGAVPANILVVEDNPLDVRLIQYALAEQKDWSTIVRVAKDGEVAMDYLRAQQHDPEWRPDLVILDLNLPKLPGIDVLRAIRSTDRTRDLSVIVLSSSPSDVMRETMSSTHLQPDLCITKPIDLDRFLELGEAFRKCFEAGRERHQRPNA